MQCGGVLPMQGQRAFSFLAGSFHVWPEAQHSVVSVTLLLLHHCH